MRLALKYVILDFLVLGIVIAGILCGVDRYLVIPLLFLWFAFTMYTINIILVKSNNIIINLRSMDVQKLFKSQIDVLEKYYNDIVSKEDLFLNYDDDDSFVIAYELLLSQLESNIASATNYLKNHGKDKAYINNLVENSKSLISKLDELCELMSEKNVSANDFLKSLRSEIKIL